MATFAPVASHRLFPRCHSPLGARVGGYANAAPSADAALAV